MKATRFEVYDKSKINQEKTENIINQISEIRINNNKSKKGKNNEKKITV